MSTYCYIGKVTDDGKVRYVFCRFDGYLEHTGEVLLKHYNKDNIDSLLDLGDLAFLGEIITPTDSEPSYRHGYRQCLAYGRDYGETDCEARYMETPYDYWETEEDDDIEYKYLLGSDGVWYCWNILFDCEDYVKPLSEALDELGCCP